MITLSDEVNDQVNANIREWFENGKMTCASIYVSCDKEIHHRLSEDDTFYAIEVCGKEIVVVRDEQYLMKYSPNTQLIEQKVG